ncbi:three-prime repair exonuclease 1-like [Danaus plexippus]|uniref:three-prime repair exonuclease 1-like n=1 Tax=Danaus plexippus TaxID=13037 RepID=UPI002AB245E4|nr:three-prime repair exonuclease 1-like [Danaus plexippus]
MPKNIQTYVFIDLETTGMPVQENNKTRITEISLVAVKREHLLDTRPGYSPRVQQRITLCLNPGKYIDPGATKVSGLCNDLLEYEPTFNQNLFNTLNSFINLLKKPICLIAQNGLNFDFPILRNHLEKLGVSFAKDIKCADCFYAFYHIMEGKDSTPKLEDIDHESDNSQNLQSTNESSPTSSPTKVCPETPIKRGINRSRVRRRFPWSDGNRPKDKYKLKYIYERLLNRTAVNPHRAENDCLLALECAAALSKQFVKWVDQNNCLFSRIHPMTVGVPLHQA